MPPIVYNVAISADGFIAGRSGDVDRFQRYACAIVGRATHAFGHRFDLAG